MNARRAARIVRLIVGRANAANASSPVRSYSSAAPGRQYLARLAGLVMGLSILPVLSLVLFAGSTGPGAAIADPSAYPSYETTPSPEFSPPRSVRCADAEAKSVVYVGPGANDFDILAKPCVATPAGRHLWLMAVLKNVGEHHTTNYYPLGDLAELDTKPGPDGTDWPSFASHVNAQSSDRCWVVVSTPDSLQADLVAQHDAEPRVPLIQSSDRLPSGILLFSACVTQ